MKNPQLYWRPIPGFEGYEASSDGHIRDSKTDKQLKETMINSGYLTVYLRGTQLVHRLVCSAFIKKTEPQNQVNHINGITTDNRPQNLEWVSLADNVRDFWSNPIFSEKQQKRKEQISKCMRERIWITDGSNNHRVLPEEMERYPDFHPGRTNKSKRGIEA